MGSRTSRKVLAAGIVALLLVGFCILLFWSKFHKATGKSFRPEFQKGMTYATWNKDALGSPFSDTSLERLRATNTEWVAFVPVWYQVQYNSTEIATWLNKFYAMYTRSQWKREAAPNGTKFGTTALSQRGDHRMPPNTSATWFL